MVIEPLAKMVEQTMIKKVAVLSIIAWLLFVCPFVNAQNIHTELPAPTPILFPPPNQSLYPEMICPYFAGLQSGYSWQGITIGETTQNELEIILSEFGNYEIIYRHETSLSNAIRYRWDETRSQAIARQAPSTIDICLQDGLVVVMEVNWSNLTFPINDLIINLGIPDVVTWSWTENRRIAFWFKQGIAAELFTQYGDAGSFGLVIRLIYFPPQNLEAYETRWPYIITRMRPFNSSDPSIPNEQNPFDFAAMLATITAEPSRTSTPFATESP